MLAFAAGGPDGDGAIAAGNHQPAIGQLLDVEDALYMCAFQLHFLPFHQVHHVQATIFIPDVQQLFIGAVEGENGAVHAGLHKALVGVAHVPADHGSIAAGAVEQAGHGIGAEGIDGAFVADEAGGAGEGFGKGHGAKVLSR